MTQEEREIREALGPFTVIDQSKKEKKKFDVRRFKSLASEVNKIYRVEEDLGIDEAGR